MSADKPNRRASGRRSACSRRRRRCRCRHRLIGDAVDQVELADVDFLDVALHRRRIGVCGHFSRRPCAGCSRRPFRRPSRSLLLAAAQQPKRRYRQARRGEEPSSFVSFLWQFDRGAARSVRCPEADPFAPPYDKVHAVSGDVGRLPVSRLLAASKLCSWSGFCSPLGDYLGQALANRPVAPLRFRCRCRWPGVGTAEDPAMNVGGRSPAAVRPAGLRAFGDGYVSLLLPVYLLALGLSPFEVGVITTGTLLGSGALTLAGRPARLPLSLPHAAARGHCADDGDRTRLRGDHAILAAAGRRLYRHAQSIERRRQHFPASRAGGARPHRARQTADGGVRALQPRRRAGRRRRRAVRRRRRNGWRPLSAPRCNRRSSRCSCSTR